MPIKGVHACAKGMRPTAVAMSREAGTMAALRPKVSLRIAAGCGGYPLEQKTAHIYFNVL